MAGNVELISDAFCRDLAFGTGGLRGTIGAGTNRMNIYTVRRASQGLSNCLKHGHSNPSVVLARDSRIKSELFAKAAAGIVITASHNPKKYNGYKVYDFDGCQITTKIAKAIQEKISLVDMFKDVKYMAADSAFVSGMLEAVDSSIYDNYLSAVKAQSVLYGSDIDKNISIVYTPLNGTGLKPVTEVLKSSGYENVTVVESQADPDGEFPTCPKPNPEERSAMDEGLSNCRAVGADLLIATDPDVDRCGIAVRSGSGEYVLLSANETGVLLFDYICSQRLQHHTMPDYPVFMKTIVTTPLAEKIAKHYGVEVINTLTGFKFIGEKIGDLEVEGREEDFIFAFEESYGYFAGSYVRDKDRVLAAYLIAEMFCCYKTNHVSLPGRLQELYEQYGYTLDTQHSFKFGGPAGIEKMKKLMDGLRTEPMHDIAGQPVVTVEDYKDGLGNLPPSNVMKFQTKDYSLIIRPSGTEPKLKMYISVVAENRAAAEMVDDQIKSEIQELIYG